MTRPLLTAAVALCLLGGLAAPAEARPPHVGVYSKKHFAPGFSYRTYRYFSPTHKAHRHHFAVYHPRHPRFVYFYNPHAKRYWGRYDLTLGGYSLLEEKDRKPTIGEIPESAFPAPGEMPPPEPGVEGLIPPPPEVG